ncbi:hypothetical protein B7463_g3358, partial [Scytalidium lignicola]
MQTRLDLAFTTSRLLQFLQNPSVQHLKVVKHIYRYLIHTHNYGITFGGDLNYHGYSDADYGGCIETRRSTIGYVFFLAGGPISWRCYSVLGSIRLLLQASKSAFIILGTFIMITSLAIGLFMQQSIRKFACEQHLLDVNASLPVVNYFDGMYTRTGAGLYDFGFGMEGSMINGLTDLQDNSSAVLVFCLTGNCTFQAYVGITHSSIGLCSSCIDPSSAIKTDFRSATAPDNFIMECRFLASVCPQVSV